MSRYSPREIERWKRIAAKMHVEIPAKGSLAEPAGSGRHHEVFLCHHRWEKVGSFAVWSTATTAVSEPPPGTPTFSLFACIFCREERTTMDTPNTERSGSEPK